MSEIRSTTTIEEINVPPREPLVSFADVLMSEARGTLQGASSATTTAGTGKNIIHHAGTSLLKAQGDLRRHATFSEVDQIAATAGSAREAVTLLAAASAIEVPHRVSKALATKLTTLVTNNDKIGVAAVARDLVAARQSRLHSQLIPLVVESCRAIGFVPTGLSADLGLVAANRPGTRQCMNIDVARTKDGGVQLHLDADGFEGAACVETLNSLQSELRKRGVECDLQERRRKPSRPVRIGRPVRVRLVS